MTDELVKVPQERIERCILLIRGQKVILSGELAILYGVETKKMLQAVKRNITRFPEDFMFQLTKPEANSLRSQIVTLERGRYSKYLPYAFTEQGVAMLSSVLNSERAVKVNIEIIRSFVRLRQLLAANTDLSRRFDALEKKLEMKYDKRFRVVFDALRQLMAPVVKPKRKIGFAK